MDIDLSSRMTAACIQFISPPHYSHQRVKCLCFEMSDFTLVTKIDDHNKTSIGEETDSLLHTQHM